VRLPDLDARFVGRFRVEGGRRLHSRVESLQGAQGVLFQCPKCAEGRERGADEETGRRYAIGAHYVICWFRNPQDAPPVPDDVFPGPGRWTASGTSLEDLTLSPSVLLTGEGGCGWHGFVRNGDAA